MKRFWLIVATLGAGVLIADNRMPATEPVAIDLTQWTPPAIGAVGDDPFGKLVKHGHALFTDTANEIGPAVSDPAEDYWRCTRHAPVNNASMHSLVDAEPTTRRPQS
jgi:hypothetical protein